MPEKYELADAEQAVIKAACAYIDSIRECHLNMQSPEEMPYPADLIDAIEHYEKIKEASK